MAWKVDSTENHALKYHEAELEYIEEEKVNVDIYKYEGYSNISDHGDPNKTVKINLTDPNKMFKIREQKFLGCFCKRKKIFKKELHNPLESYNSIEIYKCAQLPNMPIKKYNGYVDAHLLIQMIDHEMDS